MARGLSSSLHGTLVLMPLLAGTLAPGTFTNQQAAKPFSRLPNQSELCNYKQL
jgi:hypothetical protein